MSSIKGPAIFLFSSPRATFADSNKTWIPRTRVSARTITPLMKGIFLIFPVYADGRCLVVSTTSPAGPRTAIDR